MNRAWPLAALLGACGGNPQPPPETPKERHPSLGEAAAATCPRSDNPSMASRYDVLDAMKAAGPRVQSCFRGQVRVKFEFHCSGKVLSLEFLDSTTQAEQACMRAVLTKARLPPFSRDTMSVIYPFRSSR